MKHKVSNDEEQNQIKKRPNKEQASNKNFNILTIVIFIVSFVVAGIGSDSETLAVNIICDVIGGLGFAAAALMALKLTNWKKWPKRAVFIISALFAITFFVKINTDIQMDVERHRDYYIKLDESIETDKLGAGIIEHKCYLEVIDTDSKNEKYNGENQTLGCAKQSINGVFSSYKTVELVSDGLSNNPDTNADDFELSLYESVFSRSDWESDTIDFDNIKKKGVSVNAEIQIYNKVLKKNVSNQKINIHYTLSDDDIELLKINNTNWKEWKKAEEARIAKEKAEAEAKKAAEKVEKGQKESANAQSKEDAERAKKEKEAADKAEAERKAAEEKAAREAAAAATKAAEDERIANATSGHSYDELLRNSSNYKGTYMRFTGAILQTDSSNSYCRVGIHYYDYGYGISGYDHDEVLYVSPCKSDTGKLLEGDVITFTGVGNGAYTYTAVLGNNVELPSVKAISSTVQVIGKNK